MDTKWFATVNKRRAANEIRNTTAHISSNRHGRGDHDCGSGDKYFEGEIMGASIMFQVKSPTSLGVNAASRFVEVCEDVFGTLPRSFNDGDLVKLGVVALMDTYNREAWKTLIDAIQKHDSTIEVFCEY